MKRPSGHALGPIPTRIAGCSAPAKLDRVSPGIGRRIGPAASGEGADDVFRAALGRLRAAGLRPTRQRLGLLRLLLDGHPRHVTAEQALAEARATGLRVSLATVYNTLRQLAAAGVLRRVAVGRRTLFDTNPAGHYHFLDERRGEIRDIPAGQVGFARLPAAPAGYELIGVDVVVRLRVRQR